VGRAAQGSREGRLKRGFALPALRGDRLVGAKGKRHKGIAVAVGKAGDSAPRLVAREKPWSRTEVLEWVLETAREAPTLYGFDFSFAPPIAERGEYLPGEPGVPTSAREFWAYVDRCCQDEDLGAASFLESTHRPHFYFGIVFAGRGVFVVVCERPGSSALPPVRTRWLHPL
jgi:hypothetical protein